MSEPVLTCDSCLEKFRVSEFVYEQEAVVDRIYAWHTVDKRLAFMGTDVEAYDGRGWRCPECGEYQGNENTTILEHLSNGR